jgi:hypothetical protein
LPAIAEGERQIDQVIAAYLGHKGTLYLTDRRLLFEYGEGIVNKKYFQFGLSLGDISTVNARHPRLGGQELIIRAKNANNGFRATEITFNIATIAEQWVAKINGLLVSSLNNPSPTIVLEKEVVRIPCKYCGSFVDVFRNNTCTQCGAPTR